VVVLNPTKFADLDDVRRQVVRAAGAAGVSRVVFVDSTEADPGFGQTRQAVAGGADVVCALGGDGTVRAVAQSLAGTGVPLGVLPGGTGNLLARNLDLPVDDLDDAVRIALTGSERRIDIGWLAVDPTSAQLAAEALTPAPGRPVPANLHAFAVMAGLGFDAAVMDDAPAGLKAAVGWAAYVVAGVRSLRGSRFEARIALDHGRPATRAARTVVVGNCGQLTGGVELFPDARPDDGILDVVTISPKGIAAWARVVADVLTRGDDADAAHVHRRTGSELVIEVDPSQRAQVDGDVLPEAARVRITVAPAALLVRVPGLGDRKAR